MEITDVRVKLINVASDRLKAVCTVTFDESFVVRDVKVVEGTSGLFVAMPSRKLSLSCPSCRTKNHLRANYCNDCGKRIPPRDDQHADHDGRGKLHRDIAHPITASFRATIQEAVIQAYDAEAGVVEEKVVEEKKVQDYDYADDSVYQKDEAEKEEPKRREPKAEEPPMQEEIVAEERPRDEYGDMIAGLRGGRPSTQQSSRPQTSRERPPRTQTPREQPARESSTTREGGRSEGDSSGEDRGGRRPRGGRGRGRREETREERPSEPVAEPVAVREPAPERETFRAPPAPEPKAEVVQQNVAIDDDDDSAPFGMVSPPKKAVARPPIERAPVAQAPAVKAPVAPAPVEQVQDDADDDDAPFGSGL